VKALVAVEPAGVGDAKQAAVSEHSDARRSTATNRGRFALAADQENGVDFVNGIAGPAARSRSVDLPNAGIRANSHMLMMDRNNLQVGHSSRSAGEAGLVR